MTVTPTDILWYLARDGQQHGPLSDVEMRKLVEMGYLRETDLIWRQGFPDWRPAPSVFTPPSPPQLPPPPVVQAPVPPPQAARPQPQPQFQPQPQQVPRPQTQPVILAPMPDVAPTTVRPQREPQPAFAPRAQAPVPQPHPQPLQQPQPSGPVRAEPATIQPAAAPHAPAPESRVSPIRSMVTLPGTQPFADEPVEEVPRRRAAGKRLVIAASLLALVGGGGYLAYKNRGAIQGMVDAKQAPAAAPKSAEPAKPKEVAAKPQAAPAAPKFAMLSSLAGDAAAVDAALQKQPVWTLVKQQFPEWYGARMAEVAKLNAENQPEPAIAKHIVQALVALRRQNADAALAASTPRLKTIASTFLDNLKRLRAYHTNACYSFISQGETSPVVVEMMQNQELSGPIAAQVKAIFEAVGEGRAQPVKYASPSKDDYNVLADQLTKLGWSQSDLQLFADPRALARTSPERVCKMVQDWFQAHMDIQDAAAQERLLVETLRPVVAG